MINAASGSTSGGGQRKTRNFGMLCGEKRLV